MINDNPVEKLKRILTVIVIVFFLAIIAFVASFFFIHASNGRDADQITYWCDEITDICRTDDGSLVEIPKTYHLEPGEDFICETVLPDEIRDDTWVCYLSENNTQAYVGGELRKSYDKDNNTIIGGSLKRIHIFVPLYPQDAGKKLEIVFSSNRGNKVTLRRMYIGSSLGIVENIVNGDIVNFILIFALLCISIIAIFIGLILVFSRRIRSPILPMGLGVLFVCFWLIFDSSLFQFAFRQYYIDGTMSYLMVLIIPYPFVYYMDMLQEHRYRLSYTISIFFLEIVTACACLLHFSNTVDFLTMIGFLAFTVFLIIFNIVVTLIIDLVKGHYRSYLISYIGMVGLLLMCILEVVRVVAIKEDYSGIFIITGLFWTITLAIIHQLYEVRAAQREAAMASRASETKTNFLANMSHEIRTPMNAILGMDEMILREAGDNPRIAKYAADIKSAGNMLLSIINDIVDLSKIESGKAELVENEFEICSVINDLSNIMSRRAEEKGLLFSFDASADIPSRLCGDEIRIRQIMLNIINNAVKYTKEGSVTIRMDAERIMDETGNEAVPEKVMITVRVADTGIGIKDEDKDKLFTPFDRLEENKNRNIEGTGLGLSIAGNYVKLMGGHIDVESVYGEGSVFNVHIPVKVIDDTPIGDLAERIKNTDTMNQADKTTVMAPNASALVVDDNEMNLEVIEGLMERTMIRTTVALSGHDAIRLMENKRFDIIFLDQMMPQMDGITTLKKLRSEYDLRGIPFIALTADAVVGAKEYYLESGFDDYLSKPVKAEDLENILSKYLPKRLLLSKEDIERIEKAENERKRKKAEKQKVVVVDPDSEALRIVKEKTAEIYSGTFVTDMEKAGKYLEKHDADYVMLKKEVYDSLAGESH